MYKRILIPVDGSDCSQVALGHGLKLAKWADAQVTLLHVFETAKAIAGMVDAVDAGALEAERVLSEELLQRAQQTAEALGVSAQTRLVEGNPGETILAMSDEFDLIVMGTHSGAIKRMLIGSVTEKILHHARRPVLVVRHHTNGAQTHPDKERVPRR